MKPVKSQIALSIFLFASLILGTIVTDYVLHKLDIVWFGRYLGYIGAGLILLSFLYSARKRKLITTGTPKFYLALHEYLAWIGSLFVLVHAGIHFNSWAAWLAVFAMLVTVASGLTGKYLLNKSRISLNEYKAQLLKKGMEPGEIDKQLFWDSLFVDAMKQWRKVHLPVTFFFAVIAMLHIIIIIFFWVW